MSSVTAVPLRPIRRPALIALWVGIVALILAALFLGWAGTKAQVAMAEPPAQFLARNAKKSGVVTTPSGLEYKVLKQGKGAKVTPNDMMLVNYEGKLVNGSVFDSTAKHGGPTPMPVTGMIPGWTEGVQLMNKGAKYRFWMPPSLAYGEQGAGQGVVPPNAVLIFDVEVLDVAPRPPMGMGGMMPGGMDQMPQGTPGQ